MCSTSNSHRGTKGQTSLNNYNTEQKAEENSKTVPPKYMPSPKHETGGWGSPNPIKSQEEGQHLLETGIKSGKQVYNVTDSGKVVKFQPDNTPENGYHSYEVNNPRDIPSKVRKELEKTGKLTKTESNKLRKGKKKKK